MKSRMRFSSVARLAIVMIRRGFAAKQLQKMMVRIHDVQRAVFTTLAYDRVLLNYDDHCEFSCSSTPVKKKKPGHEKKKSWDDHFHFLLLRALPCFCPAAREDQNGSHGVVSIDDHQQQLQCCCVDETPKSPMDDLICVDETPKSPIGDLICSPQVDREAEEFITAFYRQMRLQRQDSYMQYQEMLARAT